MTDPTKTPGNDDATYEVDLLEVDATPTLTLTPEVDLATAPTAPAVPQVAQKETKIQLDDSILSAEEKKMVADFAQNIDITNTTAILTYGAAPQKKISDFSETALEKVRTKDMGEVGDMIVGVMSELKDFGEEEKKGLFGIFKKGQNKIEALQAKYSKAETNINRIVKGLEDHQMKLMKDSAMLDKMYDLNMAYFKELTMYLLAGQQKLEEARTVEMPALVAKAQESGRAEDAQAVQDFEAQIVRFEKKLYDLDLTRTIALQMAPQIRFVQNNDVTMIEKIQTTLVNTIPLWKSQMVLALGVENASQALKAQKAVTDMTNELLKKNAETLKQTTVQVARESERGIAEIETLQKTNEALIQTFDEVLQIQKDGREKRAEAEVELRRLEGELKAKLLEVQKQ